MKTRTNCQ